MIDKIIIISILLSSAFYCKGQYPEYIYKAEGFILTAKYDSAILNYNKAFEIYKPAFSSDYFNATLAANLSGNYKLAFRYMDSCIVKGYTIDYFENAFFASLRKISKWKIFTEKYDSLRNCYLKHFNCISYQKLQHMIEIDQKVVKETQRSKKTHLYRDSIFYSNGRKIFELIRHDSLPKVELFNFETSNIKSTIPWVLIRHYFGLVNRASKYIEDNNSHKLFYQKVLNDSSLYKALLGLIDNGQFSPRILKDGIVYSNPVELYGNTEINCFARYSGTKINNSDDFSKIKTIEELFYRKSYTQQEIEEFNLHRTNLKLPPYEREFEIIMYCDNSKNLYNIDFKYWFQFSKTSQIQVLLLNENKLRFEKSEKPSGINVYFIMGHNNSVPPQFISDDCIVDYKKYE